jgi:hypothetical protein
VVTADGALVLLPMSSFPNRGRRLVSFEFTVAAFSLDVDIRLWAFRSAGRAYGYRLTALGRSCKVDEPLGKQNPDSAVSSKITNIDASTSTPS